VPNPLLVPLPAVAHEYQHPDELDIPALLMMDLLKIHNGSVIATNIWQRLNHEWSKKSSVSNHSIFTDSTIKLIKPIGNCMR
jgi:hypothetical protein